jgi:hypothetical protein
MESALFKISLRLPAEELSADTGARLAQVAEA